MFLFSFLFASATLANGISVGATRVIYDARSKEASMTVLNNYSAAYLIQSWVEDEKGGKSDSFIVTPPLFRLDGKKENMLRIVRVKEEMPGDRESVYWLSIKAIPPAPESDKNTLQLAIKTRMKLFYRPEGIPGKPEDAYSKLIWKLNGDQLQVINDSAYAVVISRVTVDGGEMGKVDFVAAKDTLIIPNSNKKLIRRGSVVKYGVINDFGGNTSAYQGVVQ
ncbi:hypothetical protein NG42_13685 [Winslowiella iniecta]|uniref:Pili assembly chaperone N-terminal domain-containing protein n=1 Tax=Winslowiella iniecta TaxID=1560201 RepID=A0A0L7T1J8_9GAMM|nr:hypothetical protein NG42_13685 [Winslowiella iniecta]KOC93045.1 hypothetical protein NG43_12525 [Winslowiella iniecta]